MRTINEIIVHCTATPEGRSYTVADIDHWHRQRGFDSIGYHYVVKRVILPPVSAKPDLDCHKRTECYMNNCAAKLVLRRKGSVFLRNAK